MSDEVERTEVKRACELTAPNGAAVLGGKG